MEQLNTPIVVALVAGVLVILALAALVVSKRRKDLGLAQQRYGALYEEKAGEVGARKALSELHAREKRFQKAQIKELSAADQERYAKLWQSIQARFVDDPSASVTEADGLVSDVMNARGYPAADYEQRLADVAVGHPNLLDHYREACEVAHRREAGDLGTEELRQAMVHYRTLFEELLGLPERELAGTPHEEVHASH
jgi:hypothetical protein